MGLRIGALAALALAQACGPFHDEGPCPESCGVAPVAEPRAAASGEAVLQARAATDDYELATMSFEHATVREDGKVRNDWDVLYGNDRDPASDELRVNTVTDDRSFIVDLGGIGFAEVPPTVDATAGEEPCAGADCLPVVAQHLYVVRTLDHDTRQYAALRVLEHDPNRSIRIRWYRSPQPDWFQWQPGGP